MAYRVSPISPKLEERKLWAIRHWCAEVSLNPDRERRSDAIAALVTEQEASLIDSLLSRDRIAAHLIYADWLDEHELASAAIAHRLAAEGFDWRYVGGKMCFFRNHIFGMYSAFYRFFAVEDERSIDSVGTWLVPLDDTTGPKIPHAAYIGRFLFPTVISKIYQASWLFRNFQQN